MRYRLAGAAIVVELRGELDIMAHQRLSPGLDWTLDCHDGDIVVDLRAVTFLDASGMKLLVRIHQETVRRGRRPALVRGNAQVSKVMRIVRLEQAFDLVGDLFVDQPFAEDGDQDIHRAG
ncbi:STAS domain-containing protein [Streptacidiphilus sp. EB129]|uniref:STAS domain-containing protein n=1 Tax=Streptacidiphilus sp. EB129 TaxID=3156262 RepID=UPI0035132368